ncbi:MAG: nucleoside deaminase [Rothia sp. (in: high G+C Gram-positive bacteria)]|uniref:nucleoside deaminase n=1 Tax=Rothia sp. (in: high G+C Gram-positive bacteria) TaxID=1885016 RepID=UPI0026DF83AD|nr:nucleoside deaminase [Rothia sp. (in: high G+C Gram-positive bacteria)]MDO5749764.1 nucleoside deaminase [Rothia sp. (in: high G+C Gram-positive bacteria)]
MPVPEEFNPWMQAALDQAQLAYSAGEIPIGAVVVDPEGMIIGAGHNSRESDHDPTGHAEINALRQAAAHRKSWRLEDCTLVVTVEPCLMCAGTILSARIPRVIFGAWESKTGAVGSVYDVLRDARLAKPVEVYAGVQAQNGAALMESFFAQKR